MKASIIDRYGSGARVRAGEMPEPVMREDDVLVQIHAAGDEALAYVEAGRAKGKVVVNVRPQGTRRAV